MDAKTNRIRALTRLDDLLSASICDSVCPAICMTEGCDYTTEMEPDQEQGYLRGLRRQHRRLGPRVRRPHLRRRAMLFRNFYRCATCGCEWPGKLLWGFRGHFSR